MIATRALVVGVEPETMASVMSALEAADVRLEFVDDEPDVVFVGELATARSLADRVEPGRIALVSDFVDRHVAEAAYAMRVRPLPTEDGHGIVAFVRSHTMIDLAEGDATPPADHWWHRHRRTAV